MAGKRKLHGERRSLFTGVEGRTHHPRELFMSVTVKSEAVDFCMELGV